mmetsp:Transcript_523/g.643  ORF Transcript_523/g.643 Transcript_523/m.643 type:complete len:239 (+) Transcript_523:490-1206(+)
MAAELKELKKLADGSPSPQNNKRAEEVLLAFKEAICDFTTLPPNNTKTAQSQKERTLAMQGYETACVLAAKNILTVDSALERHAQLLQPYYFDYRAELGDSSKRGEILALELLSLLVGKKLGDFYSLMERIPLKERSDKYINYVVELEKNLMEGNYNQLLKTRQKSPSTLYKALLNKLESTVQDEIASCIEQSYPSISLAAAAKLMNVKPQDVLNYAEGKENWKVTNQQIGKLRLKNR